MLLQMTKQAQAPLLAAVKLSPFSNLTWQWDAMSQVASAGSESSWPETQQKPPEKTIPIDVHR